MSLELNFVNFDDYLQSHVSKLFVIYSCTSKGKLENSCSKYTDIKNVCTYIKRRYFDKPGDLISRKITIMNETSKYIHILQTSKYSEFNSYKHYYIFNDSEAELETVLEFMINTDFK